ncbi:O-phospho-L-seryl-tRNA:Cys-tRNA synthase, partial [Candidatus Bathyarchaeota archaeon]
MTRDYGSVRNRYREAIIVNPLMTGGLLPSDVQKRMVKNGWLSVGYSICFDCVNGQSSLITKPPIRDFLADVAEFLGGEISYHTFGCRAAQFAVMKTISDYLRSNGDRKHAGIVLADSLCHYTTVIAAELSGLRIEEAPNTGSPEYKISAESFQRKIEEIKNRTGKLPCLIAVTHVDPYHGNLNPAEEIGKLAEEYGIPYMVNAAYTAGIMPLSMKDLHADFLTASAHKSMASLAPLGFLVTLNEWSGRLLKLTVGKTTLESKIKNKIPALFGCSIGGAPLISAMYSFQHVVDRVKRWNEELEKIRWFIREMERLDGVSLIGERPHNHHLMHFETPIFWEISNHHK